MVGECHGVKCAFRRAGTCNYMYLTGSILRSLGERENTDTTKEL